MTDVSHTEIEAPARKAPAKRRRRRTVRAAGPKPLKVPDEFAGMTATACCDACGSSKSDAEAAQRRLNEIDRAYPRQPSQLPKSPTVMEGDREWLARNPEIADEFRRLTDALHGRRCIISGGVCAHPLKGGLQDKRDHEAVARYERAKKVLAHRKIDGRE